MFVRQSKSRLKTAPTIYNSAIYQGSFFFDLTGRSRPAAALNPEPLNREPLNLEPLNPEPLNLEPLNLEP